MEGGNTQHRRARNPPSRRPWACRGAGVPASLSLRRAPVRIRSGPPSWALGLNGEAPALQAGRGRFDPGRVHHRSHGRRAKPSPPHGEDPGSNPGGTAKHADRSVGQRPATCFGSRATQVRILPLRPPRGRRPIGRTGRRQRPDAGSSPAGLSNPPKHPRQSCRRVEARVS